MKFGETVYFISGENKGKKGRYIGHYRDSGYLVPFIYMESQYSDYTTLRMAKGEILTNGSTCCNVARPWDSDITTKRALEAGICSTKLEIKKLGDDLEKKHLLLAQIETF